MRGPSIYTKTHNVVVYFLPTFSLQTKWVCFSVEGKMETDLLEDASWADKPLQEAPIHGSSPNQSPVGKTRNLFPANRHTGKHLDGHITV